MDTLTVLDMHAPLMEKGVRVREVARQNDAETESAPREEMPPDATPCDPHPPGTCDADDLLAVAQRGDGLDAAACRVLATLPVSADPALFAAASNLRDRGKSRTVTYSPKVFLPVTNLCRDRCSYCTFRKDPDDPGAWTMTREEVRDTVRRARALGCTEALLCLGDRPEKAFRAYRTTLAALGHASTLSYVREVCEIALTEGLLPHTNMGVLTAEEMAQLRPVNASLGLMLENVSPRLRGKGMPHYYAPDKEPAVRLRMIEEAGALAIPFTTGILVGIGETRQERVDSLLAIRELHARHGHIQEVIVQNFRAKPDIPMADAPEPEDVEFARTVAMARLILGPEMSIQAPPNLSPQGHRLLLDAGINDWGGISPLTPDYVNPEAPWPHLAALERTCAAAGYTLKPRLCVYPEYVTTTWIDPRLHGTIAAMAAGLRDADGARTPGVACSRRDVSAPRGRDTHAPAL